jgi:hypothetical protein
MKADKKKETKEPKRRKQYREITITPCMRGFAVRVGCTPISYSTYPEILKDLARYYDDPHGVEALFREWDCRLIS